MKPSAQRTRTVLAEQAVSLDDVFQAVESAFSRVRAGEENARLSKYTALFALAVSGRVALQFVPSVEPIIPIAVLAGILWGAKDGFSLGAGAYVTSNFLVWGLQGPWTVFQALGAGLAGALAGTLANKSKPTLFDMILWSVLGTIAFECVVNVGGSFLGPSLWLGLLGLPLYFLTSLPFSIAHIGSNIVFARLLAPFLGWKEKTHELEVLAYSRRDPRTGTTTDIRLYRKTGRD